MNTYGKSRLIATFHLCKPDRSSGPAACRENQDKVPRAGIDTTPNG